MGSHLNSCVAGMGFILQLDRKKENGTDKTILKNKKIYLRDFMQLL